MRGTTRARLGASDERRATKRSGKLASALYGVSCGSGWSGWGTFLRPVDPALGRNFSRVREARNDAYAVVRERRATKKSGKLAPAPHGVSCGSIIPYNSSDAFFAWSM